MLQVEVFNYPTLSELKKAQNDFFKDLSKQNEWKLIDIKQSGEPSFDAIENAKSVLVSVYYAVS